MKKHPPIFLIINTNQIQNMYCLIVSFFHLCLQIFAIFIIQQAYMQDIFYHPQSNLSLFIFSVARLTIILLVIVITSILRKFCYRERIGQFNTKQCKIVSWFHLVLQMSILLLIAKAYKQELSYSKESSLAFAISCTSIVTFFLFFVMLLSITILSPEEDQNV